MDTLTFTPEEIALLLEIPDDATVEEVAEAIAKIRDARQAS